MRQAIIIMVALVAAIWMAVFARMMGWDGADESTTAASVEAAPVAEPAPKKKKVSAKEERRMRRNRAPEPEPEAAPVADADTVEERGSLFEARDDCQVRMVSDPTRGLVRESSCD